MVVLETGEEAFETLTKYVNAAGIEAASVTAIGAFERATVAFYEYEKKNYKSIRSPKQARF